jgi:hypothetical protein
MLKATPMRTNAYSPTSRKPATVVDEIMDEIAELAKPKKAKGMGHSQAVAEVFSENPGLRQRLLQAANPNRVIHTD